MRPLHRVAWLLVLLAESCDGGSPAREEASDEAVVPKVTALRAPASASSPAPARPSAPSPPSPAAFSQPLASPAPSDQPPLSAWKTYTHKKLGLRLRYPPPYELKINEKSAKAGDIYVALEEPLPPPKPGDPAGDPSSMYMGLHFLAGERAPDGIAAWTRTHHAQALEPREWDKGERLQPVTVAGLPAVLFNADGGLWPYDALIVQADGYVVELTVTFNAPDDRVRADFSRVVSTLAFAPAKGTDATVVPPPSCTPPGPGCRSLMIPVCGTTGAWTCTGVPTPTP